MGDKHEERGSVFLNCFDGPGRDAVLHLLLESGIVETFSESPADAQRASATAWPWATGFYVLDSPPPRPHWASLSSAEDLLVTILRDPRDLVAHHAHAIGSELSMSSRERVLASTSWLKGQESMLRSWARRPTTATELVTTYEQAAEDEHRFVQEVAGFIGLTIHSDQPPRLFDHGSSPLAASPGGRVGEWQATFDRSTAAVFESVLPDLVSELGYGGRFWGGFTDGEPPPPNGFAADSPSVNGNVLGSRSTRPAANDHVSARPGAWMPPAHGLFD